MDKEVLSDDAVISKKEAAQMMGLCTDTLDSLHKRGEGPRRIQLSERRVGYRMRNLREWLAQA